MTRASERAGMQRHQQYADMCQSVIWTKANALGGGARRGWRDLKVDFKEGEGKTWTGDYEVTKGEIRACNARDAKEDGAERGSRRSIEGDKVVLEVARADEQGHLAVCRWGRSQRNDDHSLP